tara:strand:- start:270 stop:488 length:219 start_codon:yes stop_codon:yes gene_type:complete
LKTGIKIPPPISSSSSLSSSERIISPTFNPRKRQEIHIKISPHCKFITQLKIKPINKPNPTIIIFNIPKYFY